MSYRVGGMCNNCGYGQCYDIPKGTRKEDGLEKIECPHCGVKGSTDFDPYQDCG